MFHKCLLVLFSRASLFHFHGATGTVTTLKFYFFTELMGTVTTLKFYFVVLMVLLQLENPLIPNTQAILLYRDLYNSFLLVETHSLLYNDARAPVLRLLFYYVHSE